MRIELKDRNHWISVCQRMLFRFKYLNQYSDAQFENSWHDKYLRRAGWLRFLIGPMVPWPNAEKLISYPGGFYPAFTSSKWIYKGEALLHSLQNSYTGDIYVDDDFYDVLKRYE